MEFYCYRLKFIEREILLTDNINSFCFNNEKFLPNFNIKIEHIKNTDFGNISVLLSGIIEIDESIKFNKNNLLEVIIYKINDYILKKIGNFICQDIYYQDYKFFINLNLKHFHKMKKNISKRYSVLCRAKLGDFDCKVDLSKYTNNYQIKQIKNNIIDVLNINKKSGYYSFGVAIFQINNIEVKIKILNHKNNLIELETKIYEKLIGIKSIKLIAGCDKKFKTCCNKFSNIYNFRGEEFILE